MATPKRGDSIHWTLVNWSRGGRERGREANKAIDGRGNCWQLTLPRLTSLLVLPASQHVYTTLFMCVCCMHKGAQSRRGRRRGCGKKVSKQSSSGLMDKTCCCINFWFYALATYFLFFSSFIFVFIFILIFVFLIFA